jgi:hypothetical protein
MVAALPFVALASTVIGTGVSIMGSMQQASAAESSAKYQAQVARNNQIIAEQNASYARQVGQAELKPRG